MPSADDRSLDQVSFAVALNGIAMRKFRPIDACILLFILLYSMFPSYLGMRVAGVLFNVPRALTMGMTALILIEIAANRRTFSRLVRVCRRSGGSLLFVAGYLMFRFASAFGSDNTSLSFNAAVSDILFSTVFLYLGIYFVRELDRFDKLITTMVVAAAIICFIGLVEAALGRNLVASAFPMMEITDDDYLKIALSDKVRGAYRVQSTFFHPLAFASYLVLLMPLGTYCIQRAKTFPGRVFFIGVVGLMGVNAFYTGSRAALLVMAIIALAYWASFSVNLLNSPPYVRWAIGMTNLCLIVAIAAAAVPVARHLIAGQSQDEQSSSAGRLVQLERGAETVVENPVLGVGPRMAGKYAGIRDAFGATVDNWYLTVVVESGVGALICFVGILSAMILMARRLIRAHPQSKKIRQLFRAIIIGVGCFGLFLVILSLHDETFPYLFLLMGGLVSMNDLSLRTRREARHAGSCHDGAGDVEPKRSPCTERMTA